MKTTTVRLLQASLVGGLLLSALPAAAQGIAPRVMILFDTSGSMLWDTNPVDDIATHGDGSVDHPGLDTNGNGRSDDSKMFIAKEAVRDILLGSESDIEFGLMRFHQDEGVNILNEGADGPRYRRPINYSGWGSCDSNTGGADVLVNIGANSRPEILRWIDGRENFPSDKELRGTGWTPLALSLTDTRDHFSGQVIRNDAQRDCRDYYVIMITDGIRECPAGTPARDPVAAASALRSVVVSGDSFDIKTFVIGFGPNVDGSDQLNRMARAGGTAINGQGAIDLVAGTALFAGDRTQLREVLDDVLVAIELGERCDGRDNDCDGLIDEDFPTLGNACQVGVGECSRSGQLVCTDSGTNVECSVEPGPRRAELCDTRDNDCDGDIDEGVLNACGACGDLATEICNNRDDDCDGDIDEGTFNACGTCGPEPRELCNGFDDDCDNRFDEGLLNACGDCGPTPAETCDGEDNDCDNVVDEGFDTACGDCRPTGAEVCDRRDNDCDAIIDEGVTNDCGGCGPAPQEVCNDLDDDCDGQTDEGLINDCGGCGPAPPEACDWDDNDCDGEIDEGVENACRRCTTLPGESCDNVDNDCDGQIDEDVVCPQANQVCINGECAIPCQAGECFQGRICRDGYCVLPCSNADCPSGQVCRDGACHDPCEGIACRPGLTCSLGACVEEDCYVSGCPSGEVCVNGACLDDPCASTNCGPNQGCRDGGCFDTCLGVTCPAGQICERGVCFEDACAGRACPADQICIDGACLDDPCAEIICPAGQTCFNGTCADDPCLRTTCPAGTKCRRGDCIPEIDDNGEIDNGDGEDDPDAPNNGGFTGGDDNGPSAGAPGAEACGCRSLTTPAPSPALPSLLLLALGALVLTARRRLR